MNIQKRRLRARERGQALVEMGVVLPLLLFLVMGVTYFGHATIALQNLNTGARSAARQMAMDSTATATLRRTGSYDASPSAFLSLAQGNLSGIVYADQLQVKPTTRKTLDYQEDLGLSGSFVTQTQHRFVYSFQDNVSVSDLVSPLPQDLTGRVPTDLGSLRFGLGTVFYGGTLLYRLENLTPISRFLFRNKTDPTLTMGATSMMPAELPLRGAGYGLMNLNPWLSEMVTESVDANPDYPDLIE